jgi:hypothetical protein
MWRGEKASGHGFSIGIRDPPASWSGRLSPTRRQSFRASQLFRPDDHATSAHAWTPGACGIQGTVPAVGIWSLAWHEVYPGNESAERPCYKGFRRRGPTRRRNELTAGRAGRSSLAVAGPRGCGGGCGITLTVGRSPMNSRLSWAARPPREILIVPGRFFPQGVDNLIHTIAGCNLLARFVSGGEHEGPSAA